MNRVLEHFPQAQLEERFYGFGRRREWRVYSQPWGIELGRGYSPSEAWANAEPCLSSQAINLNFRAL